MESGFYNLAIPSIISIYTNLSMDCYVSAFNDTYGFLNYVDAIRTISNNDGSNASIKPSSGESIQLFSGWNNGNVTLMAQMSGQPYLDSVNLTIEKDVYSMFIGCGWNNIGWWQDYSTNAETFDQYIPGCTVITKYDCHTQAFITHSMGIVPHDNFIITRGMGVFIYAPEESIWDGTDGTI